MRTLCPKHGKGGKIHPAGGGGGWCDDPIAAAFRLLPAAMLVVATALRPEDQEVLAHMVSRKSVGAEVPPPEPAPARGGVGVGRRRRGHSPTIGCECFECYTTFWSRWDCSPQSDLIHDALAAFEQRVFVAETDAIPPSSSSKRRDKGKRGRLPATPPPPPPPPQPPLRHPKSPVPQAVEVVVPDLSSPLPLSCPPPPPPPAPAAYTPEEMEMEKVPESSAGECEAAEDEERKRGWADVMGGVLGLRLWGIWSPAV